MSHTLLNVTRGAALTGAVAGVSRLVGPPLAAAVGAVVAATAGVTVVAVAHHVVRRAAVVSRLTYAQRAAVTRWVSAAVALHIAWTLVVMITRSSALDGWLLVGLLALAALEHQVARGLSYLWARPPVTRANPAVTGDDAVVAPTPASFDPGKLKLDEARVKFTAALRRARLGWLRVTDVTAIQGGWRFEVLTTSATESKGRARTFGPGHGPALALALREVLGIRFRTSWVQVTSAGYAGEYHVSVVTEDRQAVVIPYVETFPVTPLSITDPCPIGYQLDGTLVSERLDQHGQTIGKSRWGKSSLAHRKAAHVTRCVDAEWWVAGTEKLYDLVGGWLAPYEHLDVKSPIDYVAYGLDDLLELLVGAMRLARHRQRVPLSQRHPWHKVIITIDEASFALENTSAKVLYDGQRRTAADLVAMLNKGGGSGEVYVHTYNQRGTNDQLGDQGGTIKANSGFVEVFNSQDPDEYGRAFRTWKLDPPRHKGVFWVNVGGDGDGEVVQVKGEYLQEVDPARAHLHDGLTVSDVAWNRRDLIRDEPFDAAERAALGDAYARRHRTAAAQIAYLTGEPSVDENRVDEETEAYREAQAALAALLHPRPETGSVVLSAAERDRVVAALGAHPGASVRDLLDAVNGVGDEPLDEAEVEAFLGKLFGEEVGA